MLGSTPGQGPSSCPTLVWSVHLARRAPRRTGILAVIILLVACVAWVGFGSVFFGIFAAVLLVASLSDYLLPLHYQLDDKGASARGLWHRRYLPWARVRRVIRDDLGVKLSPLARPSRLEAYRGIYIWFSHQNADEVMAAIAQHISAEAAGGGDRSPVEFVSRAT